MKNMAASTIFATAIALALAASPLSAADRLQPGQWEFTTTHPGKNDPTTFKHCVTATEAASANGIRRRPAQAPRRPPARAAR